jgi:methyl-accepting chemotaxis protein
MNLRDMKIGLRLGLGFGLILLAASVMLVGTLINNGASRAALLETMQRATAHQDLAANMRHTLLSSAVAVRNMGLQTTVEGVQKDEAEAKKQRTAYLAAKGKLEATDLGPKERELFGRLADIDRQMDAQFKEAVDLASQFNTEQAGAVITGKIDPLLTKASDELAAFIAIQKQRTDDATEQANASNRATVNVISIAAALVLVLAGLMAWRLTTSITRPLQTAQEATARVACGDLVSDIQVDGRDEAAQLLAGLYGRRSAHRGREHFDGRQRNCLGQRRPVTADRNSGQQSGRNCRFHGGTQFHRKGQRRHRAPGESTGRFGQRSGSAGRGCGGPGGRHHAGHHRSLAQDRGHHQRD